MEEDKLNYVYYIWGWKRWIYNLFMKYVYSDIKKGWTSHKKLIESGSIIHTDSRRCIICK